ncbi:MAG TPA: serine hydrolase domain-containing protein [Thermomicrobiaceae bacterium]|nr:serine hydrolase domain-containing protein [Thermomicrobiaceae bacterium]
MADDTGTKQADYPEIQAALNLYEARLAAEQEHQKIPGFSAGVIFDQELVWARGFGYADLASKRPADAHTFYRVGSITKLFTATMLMQLRDAGKLHLDDPLAKYLPDFAIKSSFPDAKPPTFRGVVCHYSGLPTESPGDYWGTLEFPDLEAALASLEDAEMAIPAFTEFKYSNMGIGMMGQTLARIAGEPYRDYITNHILRPLGMNASGFEPRDNPAHATGYLAPGDEPELAPWPMIGFAEPAGALSSSVEEMAKFVSLQFRDGPAGGSQILGGTSLREMHTPIAMTPDWEMGFGIGFGIRRSNGHVTFGHGGGIHGFTTQVVALPDYKLGVIVFTNTSCNPDKLAELGLDILVPVLDRYGERAVERAEREATTPEEWAVYVGCYQMEGLGTIEISLGKGCLIATMVRQPDFKLKLKPAGEHRFRSEEGRSNGEIVSFELDDSGKSIMLRLGSYPFARVEEE